MELNYQAFMDLALNNPVFGFNDTESDGHVYRIFNYKILSTYHDFLAKQAMECRGVMYRLTPDKEPELVARPMEKFFNWNENPLTTGLDLTTVKEIQTKADGSLISTYVHTDGTLRLKSRGSIDSVQVKAAEQWIPEEFRQALLELTRDEGLTVNLEWCAPDNQVVLDYEEPDLKVLNARRRSTGEYVSLFDHPVIGHRVIPLVKTEDPVGFVRSIREMTEVEGFVVRLESGQRIKIKTKWYADRHKGVGGNRRGVQKDVVLEAVLNGTIDDLRGQYQGSHRERIEKHHEEINRKLKRDVHGPAHEFAQNNHGLSRKEYAIKAKQELGQFAFTAAMKMHGTKQDPVLHDVYRSYWKVAQHANNDD